MAAVPGYVDMDVVAILKIQRKLESFQSDELFGLSDSMLRRVAQIRTLFTSQGVADSPVAQDMLKELETRAIATKTKKETAEQ